MVLKCDIYDSPSKINVIVNKSCGELFLSEAYLGQKRVVISKNWKFREQTYIIVIKSTPA